MNRHHWLDRPLPSALIRSWARAAGFTSEWLEEPRKVQDAELSAQQSPNIPPQSVRATFDDVQ
jgi:hypothetical protein